MLGIEENYKTKRGMSQLSITSSVKEFLFQHYTGTTLFSWFITALIKINVYLENPKL